MVVDRSYSTHFERVSKPKPFFHRMWVLLRRQWTDDVVYTATYRMWMTILFDGTRIYLHTQCDNPLKNIMDWLGYRNNVIIVGYCGDTDNVSDDKIKHYEISIQYLYTIQTNIYNKQQSRSDIVDVDTHGGKLDLDLHCYSDDYCILWLSKWLLQKTEIKQSSI